MSYELGTLEKVIIAIKERLEQHQATGERLANLKHIFIGDRPIENGSQMSPMVMIYPVNGDTKSTTQAFSQGSNTLIVPIEIKLIHHKLKENSTVNSYAQNTLFDSQGNGVIAMYQNIVYALVFDVDGNYTPTLGLQLDKMPLGGFNTDPKPNYEEYLIQIPFDARYIYDEFCGSTT